jgi:hypothetical protein
MGLSPTLDYLWMNYTGTSNTTAYYQLQTLSDLPHANYVTSGNSHLFTSQFDAGFMDVDKTYNSVRFRTDNCSSTQTIVVHYSIDGGAWASLGTVNTSPDQTLDFPDCVANTVYGKKIQLRLDFTTDDSAQSPVLEAHALRYMLRPDTVWGWQVRLQVSDYVRLLDGRVEEDEFTAEDKITALETARDAECPCTMVDPWGTSHTVFVTAINMNGLRRESTKNPELIATVSFIKV